MKNTLELLPCFAYKKQNLKKKMFLTVRFSVKLRDE